MTVAASAEVINERMHPVCAVLRGVQCGALSTAVLRVSGVMAHELWG